MTWEEHYRLYIESLSIKDGRPRRDESEKHLRAARQRVAQNSPEDWQWLISSLDDDERKWFVAEVFRLEQLPKRLFFSMIRAGVLERDPSLNRNFIEPCLRCLGTKRVCAALIEYLERGNNREKAGAASALYWAWRPEPGDDMSDLQGRIWAAMLQEFVYNEDLRVRRRIIAYLNLKPDYYPEELRPLVQRAIKIARDHPDDYIRRRVERQLDNAGPLMAIPDND